MQNRSKGSYQQEHCILKLLCHIVCKKKNKKKRGKIPFKGCKFEKKNLKPTKPSNKAKHYKCICFWRTCITICVCVPTVPEPVLRCTPPRQLDEFHTLISAQACMRSTDCRPSYTIVWLKTGLTEPRTTRVCWPLTPLSSGKITLQTHNTHSHVLFLWEQIQIFS